MLLNFSFILMTNNITSLSQISLNSNSHWIKQFIEADDLIQKVCSLDT